MSAVPAPYVIPRHDMVMSEAMPFNQHWEVRVPVPIKEIKDMGDAVRSASASLRPGDQMVVVSFKNKDWRIVTGVATFRVVGFGERGRPRLMQIGKTVDVAEATIKESTTDEDKLDVRPRGTGFIVVDKKGNEIEYFVDKPQADAFANRENAKLRRAA